MTDQDIAGIVFLAGMLSFSLGVATPSYTGLDNRVWNLPHTREHLEIIGRHRRAWRWARAWTVIAALLIVLGLGLLAELLRGANGYPLGQAALLLFLPGALFWAVAMGFQMGVEPLAADILAEESAIPDWFEPMEAWIMMLMFFYLVVAYAATALIGLALLQTTLLPAWVGWLSLVLGVAGGFSMIANYPRYPGTEYSIAAVPAWLYLVPLLLGTGLILQ